VRCNQAYPFFFLFYLLSAIRFTIFVSVLNFTVMEIRVKSLKFDADEKLLAYVDKKVSKLAKFFDGVDPVDVTLSLLHEPDNKNVSIQAHIPGEELIIERNAKTFEEAVTEAVDLMKEKIVRAKEKKFEK